MALHGTTLMSEGDKKYQAEDDHRTLMRAAEVVANKSRVRAAMRLQAKQEKGMATLQSVLAKRRTESV